MNFSKPKMLIDAVHTLYLTGVSQRTL